MQQPQPAKCIQLDTTTAASAAIDTSNGLQHLSVDTAATTTTDAAATTEGSYLMQLCCLLAALRCGLCWYFVKIFHWFSTFLWLFSLLPCGARCCMRISPQKSNENCVKIVCVKYLIESNNINWECLFAWQTFNLATMRIESKEDFSNYNQ